MNSELFRKHYLLSLEEEFSSQYLSANSSRADVGSSLAIRQFLDNAMNVANHEFFESGYNSVFSLKLDFMFSRFPEQTITLLNEKITNHPEANPEILAEVMRWASRQESESVHQQLVMLSLAGLNHYSSLVRDEASVALAQLEDKRAIPFLNKAVRNESEPELRQDIQDLIASLYH